MSENNTEKKNISRRGFLAASGGVTFAVAAYAVAPRFGFVESAETVEEVTEQAISAWVRIDTTGRITIYNPSAEMGQGSMTALPLIFAEEMDADWKDVVIEQSPIEPAVYGSVMFGNSRRMITVGSRAVSGYFDSLRIAGAQVRRMLITSAAGEMKVPASELTTEPGAVVHKKSGKRLTFGEIAGTMTVPDAPPNVVPSQLKDPKDFRLIGKEHVPRMDIPSKTDGSAQFAVDVRLPGMVYAVISRSLVHGAKAKLTNESAVAGMKGVLKVVPMNQGIGVIAETIEAALDAKGALKIDWSGGDSKGYNSQEWLSKYAAEAAKTDGGRALENKGDADSAIRHATRKYSADYLNDHVVHAQMEPLNAVVSVAKDGKSAEVWAGSQAPDGARNAAAAVLGISREKVKFNQMYLGGGFGRRSTSDYVEEAAELAKHVDRPLKLMWTREDDITYGMMRPASLQRMEAGVDREGKVVAWKHTIVGTGGGLLTSGSDTQFYSIPNQKIERKDIEHGIRTKHWRAVGHGPNKFAIEAFIDEIAHGENKNPYMLRRELMADFPRAIKVLDTAAEMSGWDKPSKEGRAKGIAFAERSGSLCAGVVELSLEDFRIRVHRIWCALDAGIVVQPDNVRAQSEGSMLMALSTILHESITYKDGAVEQSNFDDYHLLRIDDTPELIDINLIPSTEHPSGVGEAALPFMGGAVSNALFALTGKRFRHMPFTPERVRAVLGETP
ncbi:MAG: xanthine dehydrogenase family protein molybdopterin-binding subunit [Acidobacteria bacterium]|nr:MAG: xanthine dehydrogenase family protein molybdopterin-binding subunit [Acidobacteriota bacterium]REK02454.1 MAG: xanthine dehydrogenase family protein molybdopterin-binding subunit [Acidobacteriota bacterium]REK13744.1 MAG: xanthine dehydrogenase family protein molybdopterin-binding subunit [Acidobacteriota bacterium]REK41738.1 MAG: xanthine dehydrogenase family protein molybdopterin-binding subunit [Acidobacteriota bacterium]